MKYYETQGDIDEADCVIGHSFGTSVGEGSVNQQLAWLMTVFASESPMIADRTLVDALPDNDQAMMAEVVEGPVTNMKAQGVGTWGTLVAAHRYMKAHDLHRPIQVGQAYHIERIVRQAAKLGMPPSIVPEGLPQEFDRKSEQPWTRSAALWVPMNAVGSVLLRMRGQL